MKHYKILAAQEIVRFFVTRTVFMTMASLKLDIDQAATLTIEVSMNVQLFFLGT